MGNDGKFIDFIDSCAFCIGQTKPATDGLFPQRHRGRGTEGNDCIKVRYIPALFQHINVDDDFDFVIGMF